MYSKLKKELKNEGAATDRNTEKKTLGMVSKQLPDGGAMWQCWPVH